MRTGFATRHVFVLPDNQKARLDGLCGNLPTILGVGIPKISEKAYYCVTSFVDDAVPPAS